ncbi:MAG: DUF5058 family protein [Clostridiales Family XIII bacterium]|jgi:hypothetical protein|nr:DUF5058 family protein [Clostridiales Family XIII bacterium]
MSNVNAIDVANSPAIWVLAGVCVLVVVVQTALFLRLAYRTARSGEVKITSQQCSTALRAGIVSAIGPALGVFVVMIGLISILGGPMAWLRLSVIGGASTELAAATVGVEAAGGDIMSGSLTMEQLSTAWWTMAINACGWLVVTFIFASRMEKLRNKIGGGDSMWMEFFSSAATLGIFGAFCSEYIVEGVKGVDIKTILACVIGGVAMLGILTLAKRFPRLKEYAMGLAMVIGIVVATIFPAIS